MPPGDRRTKVVMSKLDYITVQGFKSIESVEELAIGPLTVLIGPNGSGKTNFVGVFSFLNAVREGRLQEYVVKAGGADKVLHFGSDATSRLHVRISFQQGVNQYEVDFEPNGADELLVVSENGYFWDKQRYSKPDVSVLGTAGREAAIRRPDVKEIARHVQRHLSSWRLYHFHDTSAGSPLKKTADVNDNRHLRPNGANLGAIPPFSAGEAQGRLPVHRGNHSTGGAVLPGLHARAPAPEPRQDQTRVEARGNGRLFRRSATVGRNAAFHGAGDPVSPAYGVPAIGHRGRRTRAGHAPLRNHPVGGVDEAGSRPSPR